MTKNENISASIKLTREKRKSQSCKVFTVKIDKSHLNSTSTKHLNRLFLEAKWFYNYVLTKDPFNFDYKIQQIPVKVNCAFYLRSLNVLSSQMKQSMISQIQSNIKSLSTNKKKGEKVGHLKFKSETFSVPLRQYSKDHSGTYKFYDKNHIHIQNIDQRIKVSGLNQIPLNSDIANANLIHKNGDYYISIVTFQHKHLLSTIPNTSIGIDFGLSTQLSLSNGIKINYNVPISSKLKVLSKSLSRKKLHSKNWYKTKTKLNKEYQYLNNIKQDIKNKIVSHLKTNYNTICFQDESLKAWQSRYGSKIQSTSIGRIISSLKQRVHTPVKVDRFYPSTQLCSFCHNKQKLYLDQRIYVCPVCNTTIDRDLNAALNIHEEGLTQLNKLNINNINNNTSKIPMVYRKFTPDEIKPLQQHLEYLNSIPYVSASSIHDPGSIYTIV